MRSSFLAGLFLAITSLTVEARQAVDEKQAAAAKAILDPWIQARAKPVERRLHIICWTPGDREFPADHRARLTRMLTHIQAFYSEEMERNGFGPLTFSLDKDPEGLIRIYDIRGREPTSHYEKKSGDEIRTECLPTLKAAGIAPDDATYAIFCNLATWDPKALTFKHKSPYYAGGNDRHGTAWQLDSPELDTTNLPKKAPTIRDGEYGKISLGKHNSIFIGGMAHELGHAFGLPHVTARPDEAVRGDAIMGTGNRSYGDQFRDEGPGAFLSFAHALRLASHPLFNGHLETERIKPRFKVDDLEIRAVGKAIKISGTLTGIPPVYGVVAYFDPAGNDDYNETSMAVGLDAKGSFRLQCDALKPGSEALLKIVPLHASGAIADDQQLSSLRFSYRVARDGTPDLSTIHAKQLLAPVVDAVNNGNLDRAKREAAKIQVKDVALIAVSLVEVTPPKDSPAEDDGRQKSVPLTRFKAESAEVGWFKPSFNRLPSKDMLLESSGRLYATGLYAHAPAKHVYRLGGKWRTLQGSVGIAAGHSGEARFEILGDGKSLWSSKNVAADQLESFRIDVSQIKTLELRTTAGGPEGIRDAWGLWLEPTLIRE